MKRKPYDVFRITDFCGARWIVLSTIDLESKEIQHVEVIFRNKKSAMDFVKLIKKHYK